MDMARIEAWIKDNSTEVNRRAMEEIYSNYGAIAGSYVEQIAPLVVYNLWKVPKFSVQKEFVNELISRTDSRMREALLKYLIKHWGEIELVRRDKFYYLIKKIVGEYELSLENTDYLFSLTCNTDLRGYIISCVVSRIESPDEALEEYLLGFISRCPPNLLLCFRGLRLRRESVLRFSKKPEMHERNRNALYSLVGGRSL
jgi:hypothetical protein